MKLLLCKNCGDVFSLSMKEKTCTCGKTKGKYNDCVKAEYEGEDAMPIGFANYTFRTALANQPESGMGYNFTAFIIPKNCDTFIKK